MSHIQAFMMQKEREAKGLSHLPNKQQSEPVKDSGPSARAEAYNAANVQNSAITSSIGAEFQRACMVATSVPVSILSAEEKQRHLYLVRGGVKMVMQYLEQNGK